jgi:isorenieratene synthase
MGEVVVIIGGGVAGLTAALHVAERGLHPLVLEADPQFVGGRMRNGPTVTLTHAGQEWSFTGEHGVHGIWNSYVNLKAVLARHQMTPAFYPSPDEAWIYAEGNRVRRAALGSAIHTSPIPAPLHYLYLFTRPRFIAMLSLIDLLTMPRVFGTMLVALAVDPIGEQNALRGESLAHFTRGWSPRLRSFFAGLARNALAAHPEDAPAAGFVAFLRFYTIARRDSWAFSFAPGTGGTCITEPLAKRAQQLGATIQLGAHVTQIEHCEQPEGTPSLPRWKIQYVTQDGEQTVEADQVILAIDAPAAARLLRDSPPTAERAKQCWFPQGVPTAIFRIWYERKPKTPAITGILSGDFIVDNFFWMDAFQPEYAAWSAATGGGAVEMHIYGPPELLEQPDAVLLARAVQDAGRAFPDGGKILHAQILRNTAVHTLFNVGEVDAHLGVETPWPGLVLCGDWVAHPIPALYLERAATTGIAAANAVLKIHGIEPWAIIPHPQPEPLAKLIGSSIQRLRRFIRRRHESTKMPESR